VIFCCLCENTREKKDIKNISIDEFEDMFEMSTNNKIIVFFFPIRPVGIEEDGIGGDFSSMMLEDANDIQ
jgi:hypothetical protein